jgi:hypothetical protein
VADSRRIFAPFFSLIQPEISIHLDTIQRGYRFSPFQKLQLNMDLYIQHQEANDCKKEELRRGDRSGIKHYFTCNVPVPNPHAHRNSTIHRLKISD